LTKPKEDYRARIVFFFLITILFFITARIFQIQIGRGAFLKKLASQQHLRTIPLKGRRGLIYDRRGRIITRNLSVYSLYADPVLVDDPDSLARNLSGILNQNATILAGKLRKQARFVWIERKISLEKKRAIEALHIKGLGFIREEKRFYPQGSLFCHILGGVNVDNKGIEGIELFYDSLLKGKDGLVEILRDAASNNLIISSSILNPEDGCGLTLTLDAQIQYWVKEYLQETIEKFGASAGSVVVMDPRNGEILAMANYPVFDSNELAHAASDVVRNRAVTDIFEPGSVFKAVTLVAALDSEAFKEEDEFFCEQGAFKIPGSTLHDWKPYGQLTFRGVFKKSSNIGVAKIASSLGKEALYRYIKKLGFAQKTGVDIGGEAKGFLKVPDRWSRTSAFIIPIGQEVGVTAIQLASAFSIIANGGYALEPHLLKKSSCQGGFHNQPSRKKKRVISRRTSDRAKAILVEVVAEGTGRRAQVVGLDVGGKTGTAQKYDPQIKRYSPHRYRASFVGFLPKDEPKLVICVTIDEPRKSHFGGVVAAPLFKKIAERTIQYLETSYNSGSLHSEQ